MHVADHCGLGVHSTCVALLVHPLRCRLFYKLFLAVNTQAETVIRYMQAVGPAAVATAGSVDQIRGLECIWNLAVLSPNASISTRCATVLCDLYSCLVPREQVRHKALCTSGWRPVTAWMFLSLLTCS